MINKIIGSVKKYAWGGFHFLPNLLGENNRKKEPWAEYWLGTHHLGMATMKDTQRPLASTLDPSIGGELPFLFKVLDVREMLSIQVHPTKNHAEMGFARENQAGIAIDAFERTYRDKNHKPELMVALSEFWLLQGFKTTAEVAKVLTKIEELSPLLPHLLHGGMEHLFGYVMAADQEEINMILKPLGKRIKPLFESGTLKKSSIDYWAAKAFLTFNRKGFCDRGIISLYLMNLVKLNPGEGIYQSPGVLHAYLEGQNIECMANSDNVIRGGLTQKFIDQHELIKVVNHRSQKPMIIYPIGMDNGLSNYPIPINEFQVHLFQGGGSQVANNGKASIAICLSGSVLLSQGESNLSLGPGEAAVATGDFDIKSSHNGCQMFLASRP